MENFAFGFSPRFRNDTGKNRQVLRMMTVCVVTYEFSLKSDYFTIRFQSTILSENRAACIITPAHVDIGV